MFQLSLTAGNPESDPLEIAILLDSFCGVLKWIFLIIVVFTLYTFSKSIIKKKNATSPKSKHSKKNTQ